MALSVRDVLFAITTKTQGGGKSRRSQEMYLLRVIKRTAWGGTGNTIFEKKRYFTYYFSLRNLASLVLITSERSERSYLGTLILFDRPTGWKKVTFAPPPWGGKGREREMRE